MKKYFLTFWVYVLVATTAAHADAPKTPDPEMVLQLGHVGIETAVAWSSDGKLLATGDDRGAVKVWRATKQNAAWTLELLRDLSPLASPVASLKWQDASTLRAQGKSARGESRMTDNEKEVPAPPPEVRVWNVRDGKLIRSTPAPRGGFGFRSTLQSLPARSPDGRTLAQAGLRWTTREMKTREQIHEIRFVNAKTHKIESVWTYRHNAIESLGFAPDGRTLYIRPADQSLRALQLSEIKSQTLFTGTMGQDSAVALSPGATLLAHGAGFERAGGVRLIDLTSQKTRLKLRVRENSFSTDDVQFSPDGNWLAASDGIQASVWSTQTGELKGEFAGHNSSLFSVAWSSDSKILATVGGGSVNLWNIESGELEGRLLGMNLFARFAAFSPDGQTTATAETRTVRLWSAMTQECLHEFPAGNALRPAFSGDGKLLAFTGENGNVCIRETATGNSQRIWRAHDSPISTLAFSPDGSTLVTASGDGTVKFWRVASQKLLLTWRLLPAARDGEFAEDWIAFTPEGNYAGSKDCERWIRWRVGDELFPASKFKADYNRPDRVRAGMENENARR